MENSFAIQFIGWSFITAGAMFWLGWMMIPHHIGIYFEPDDFEKVHKKLHFWIWMYRIHIFGMAIGAIALLSLLSHLTEHPARVIAWPGIGVATAGIFVAALAAAFYYHHGAWGALETQEMSGKELDAFTASLQVDNEYVTCLVRFGRVFTGLGLFLLGWSIVKWAFVPEFIGVVAAVLGFAAIAVTMLMPDNWSLYTPIFHLQPLWFVTTGIIILRSGIQTLS